MSFLSAASHQRDDVWFARTVEGFLIDARQQIVEFSGPGY
jgi:hypothetical protein